MADLQQSTINHNINHHNNDNDKNKDNKTDASEHAIM